MEFLLEIMTEEMPGSHLEAGLAQLRLRLGEELQASDVPVESLTTYGTCRRLVVVGDFAASQKDRVEVALGPPRAMSFSPDGSYSRAAQGFARSQGVEVAKLEVIQAEKGEYLGLKKIIKGGMTADILAESLPKIISSLTFPKMMRWGTNPMRFSRPIKNIFCLFGHKPLSFSVNGIENTGWTTGHARYFPQKIRVSSFAEYKKALEKNLVVLEREARKRMILSQAEKALAELEAQLLPDEKLLEKLADDTEHPLVFLGSFPGKYLKLPTEVLSTAMREGQNLFSVVKGNKQLPYFLGVADAFKDSKGLIRQGNEKVLMARLEDAIFFWEQDLKTPLQKRAPQLDRVVFQEELGTYGDKAQRLKKIVSYLAQRLEAKKDAQAAMEAALLCKADLLTEMVKEFPSLQGRVGGLYAREDGMPLLIWKAIYEHYQPVGMDDEVPSSLTGALLSIADKADSVVGVMGIGVEVSSSKDPFGLRRNAQGASRIIVEKKLNFSFSLLLDKAIKVYGGRFEKTRSQLKALCQEFFAGRLQNIFERQGFRYDLINAALAPGIDNIYFSYLRLKALDELKESAQFEPLILIAKRVNNILRGKPSYKLNPDLFFEKQERELFTTYTIIKNNVLPMISKGDFSKAQKILLKIGPSLHSFFDQVLVMAEDKKIRQNRLALLQTIGALLNQVADYSQIVIQGENK